MKLKDVCELNVVSCPENLSVTAAARIMRQQHTGDVIVVDDADGELTPVGILTDRDIVVTVLAEGADPDRTAVREVMARQLVIGEESEDLEVALERMQQHGVRRLPVVRSDGQLLGIVTLDDLIKVHAAQSATLLQILTREQEHENRVRR